MLNLGRTTNIIFVIVFFIGINHSDSSNKLARHRRQPIDSKDQKSNQPPTCGLKTNQAETLNVGGNNANQSDHPWHVGLYLNTKNPPEFLCSGTLISQNMIITAAHCVTDFQTNALLSKDLFSIAVGKYYSKYNDPRDVDAQYSLLERMYTMPSWRGQSLFYQADIAILITKDALKFTRRVQPICMDYDGSVIMSVLKNPQPVGTIVGWGATKEVLKELTLPYIQRDACLEKLPINFQSYLTSDKFCTGYLNKDEAVCLKNSGGGLAFRNPKDGRYYLAGVVSVAPTSDSGGCDPNQYNIYTNVTQYIKNIA